MKRKQCSCGCHCGMGHRRRFLTKAERLDQLRNYSEDLKKELQAVGEQIKELED